MDLSDLLIFSTVVREASVTRAAARLHRVQSNVTTRIRQLEEDLRVTLFIREGKRLHLAPAGHVLLDYAERLLALADEARNAVQDERPGGIPGWFWSYAPATRSCWGARSLPAISTPRWLRSRSRTCHSRRPLPLTK